MKTRIMHLVAGALTLLACGSAMAGDVGQCCLPDGGCKMVTAEDCNFLGGEFNGEGSCPCVCPPESLPPDFQALGCDDCLETDYFPIGAETETLGGGDGFSDTVFLETNLSSVVGFQIKFDYAEQFVPDSSWASDIQVSVTSPDGDQFIVGGLTNLPDADEFWSFQGSISDPPGTYGCTDADVYLPAAWLESPLPKGDYVITFTNDWFGDPTPNLYSNIKIRFIKQSTTTACCFPNGTCQDLSAEDCAAAFGESQPPGNDCANFTCPQITFPCCFPNGTCQDLTPEDCTLAGGEPQFDETRCDTFTCPQIMYPCCFLNGTCQDLPPADCSEAGGESQLDEIDCATFTCPQITFPCCFPNGTCQDLTPEDCTLAGGEPQLDETRCATFTCPQITFPCCFPNGTCQDLAPEDCTLAGGEPQLEEIDCATFTCPQITFPCCFPDGTCQDLAPEDCTLAGGEPQLDETRCATFQCPIEGACCFADHVCLILREDECLQLGGRYQGDFTVCDPNPCPPTGACCLPDGVCEILAEQNCLNADGEYQGDDSICEPTTCEPPSGACCFPDGTCIDDTGQSECNVDLGGTWQGDGTVCEPGLCPPPKGACCFTGGICGVVTEVECLGQQGEYQGDFTVCTPGLCPFGACCFDGGLCEELSQTSCANAGGLFQGDNTQCNPCPQPDLGACCLPGGLCDDTVNEETCTASGGLFQGVDRVCAEDTCDGACCLPDGTCELTGLDDCVNVLGGSFEGARTDCATTDCIGACCLPACECCPGAAGSPVDLGAAGDYAVFATKQVDMTISSGNTQVEGNVGVGQSGTLDFSGGGVITGRLDHHPDADINISGGSMVLGGIVPTDMTQAELDAMDAATAAESLSSTQTFGAITGDFSINGNGGLNAISVGSVNLDGGSSLSLIGTPGDTFVINVLGGFELSGGSTVELLGGVGSGHVLFNIVGQGNGVSLSGNSTLLGTLLAIERNVTISGGYIHGGVIGCGDFLKLQSGPHVVACPFGGNAQDCKELSPSECGAEDGIFQGFGTTCAEIDCVVVGACCLPPPPPPSGDFDCDGKVVYMTMIWDGSEAVRIKAYDGAVGGPLLADIDHIQIGDEVTIGPLAGPNDSHWRIYRAGTNTLLGESKFHRSCSDSEMDGPEDCGNREGNGKSNESGLINDWILEGLVDESGASFDCGQSGGGGDEVCMDLTPEACEAVGGTYQGDGTDCAIVECLGACCLPPPSNFDCSDKVVEMTMIWDGTEAVRIRAYDGDVDAPLLADIDHIQIGDAVTIGPLAGPNDSYWEVFRAGTSTLLGMSKFHRSCSDDEMDGPEDCGNREGNGKSNESGLINDWILEGLVDGSGASFDCGQSGGGDPTCTIATGLECSAMGGSFQGVGTDCETADCTTPPSSDCCENGKIVVLTMLYTGDDCAATSHTQDPSKVSCEDFAPLTDLVFIRATDEEDPDDASGIIWFAGDVALDTEFNFDAAGAGEDYLKSTSYFHVFDQEGGTLQQSVKFHTSCSQPLFVGNQFGCGRVVGCIGEDEAPGGAGSGKPGDANADDVVDVADLLLVLFSWGTCDQCPADLDGSGAVDFTDLLILLENWGG